MPRVSSIRHRDIKEIARQVNNAIKQKDGLRRLEKATYDGDLSWKKVGSEFDRDTLASYQPNQPTLASTGSFSKKLNII